MPGPAGSSFSPPGGGSMIRIELANEATILGRFKQRRAGLEVQANKIARELADSIVIAAKDLVPVDTGATRDSIRREDRGDGVYVVVDRLGDKAEVPIYLEIGTYKMAARPFLKPAGDLVLASGGIDRAVNYVGGLLPPVR